MTSDERREVAERLRKHDGNAYADVADMCDEDLADLIDPTCEVVGCGHVPESDPDAFVYDLSCGHSVRWADIDPPAYCPYCGARVVCDE